jgi:hypothetical protein
VCIKSASDWSTKHRVIRDGHHVQCPCRTILDTFKHQENIFFKFTDIKFLINWKFDGQTHLHTVIVSYWLQIWSLKEIQCLELSLQGCYLCQKSPYAITCKNRKTLIFSTLFGPERWFWCLLVQNYILLHKKNCHCVADPRNFWTYSICYTLGHTDFCAHDTCTPTFPRRH